MITNVYVDGFNLYYGALKGTPYKWLDLEALCRLELPRNSIHRIRYFTARVKDLPHNPGQAARQDIYLRALATLPCVSIHEGHFLRNTKRMPLASPQPGGPRFADVLASEEKGSDVNLASYLLLDGFRGDYEAAIVISNDSDLETPMHMVRVELRFPVGVLNPYSKMTSSLRRVASFTKPIRAGTLGASQFPSVVIDGKGAIHRPSAW